MNHVTGVLLSSVFRILPLLVAVATFQPEFSEPIVNLTIPLGRDATFKCLVVHLGGYRVGWVKADTKAIQAIHEHVITHNPRISVSHSDHNTWNLHLRAVQEEDQGQYMCQINTDPMKSQMGMLEVVVPPDFIPEETSSDVMIPEGSTARLACRARGSPAPRVTWRREEGLEIIIREPSGKSKVSTYQGEVLMLSKITRSEMGAYLCIATNGVPPSVSKRIMVNVHFHPVIQVPNQLVGAPLGTDVTMECLVEASPKSINYWLRDNNEMVISSSKYVVHHVPKSIFETKMSLTVRKLQAVDLGGYRCIAKNSLGEVESNIRLYEIPGPTRSVSSDVDQIEEVPDYSESDQFGSAEITDDDDEDDASRNSVVAGGGTGKQSHFTAPPWIGRDPQSAPVPAPAPGSGRGKNTIANNQPSKHDLKYLSSSALKTCLKCNILTMCAVILKCYFTI